MEGWLSYRPRDLLLFSEDTYLRQFERFNESLFPAQYLLWLGGLVGLMLALRGKTFAPRPLMLMLALMYGVVGYGFLWRLYAQINWTMHYLVLLLVAQALILVGLVGAGRPVERQTGEATAWPAILLWTIALLAFPLWEYASGRTLGELSAFALAPDPLAVLTLAVLWLARTHMLWGLPAMLWLLTSGLTLWIMESAEALLPFAVLGLTVVLSVWRSTRPGR